MRLSFRHLVRKTWWLFGPSLQNGRLNIHLPPEFRKILVRECARAERTGLHFALVRFNTERSKDGHKMQVKLAGLLKRRIRLTDELGWLEDNQIGVLLYNTDADNAIRFVAGLKNDGLDDVSDFSYEVYVYPCDQPDDADHQSGFQEKQKIFRRQQPHSESDQKDPIATGAQSHQLMNVADHQRSTSTTGRTGSISIKTLLLRIPLWKRMFDIAGALLALVIFSPVFLIVALYIKGISSGPVFFKQKRFGYGGRIFRMWKFRTMKVAADQRAHQQLIGDLLSHNDRPMNKLADDPRIIPGGNLLRKFCVDELPQLINVLRGEMSLVGPRPDPVYAIDSYDHWYTARFDAMPGMTGLWQVSGKNRLSFQQMMRLDISYARQRSLRLDLKIIFSTVPAIFFNAKYDA